MPPGASPWERVYDSAWHNPGLFWLANALFLGALVARAVRRPRAPSSPPGLDGFLLGFGLEIVADCTLTGGLSPLPSGSTAATVAGIVFVILGDLRYFWLTGVVARGGSFARRLPGALALSLIVPVLSAVARTRWAATCASPRVTFLVYELMMVAVVAVHGVTLVRRPARAGGAADRGSLRALFVFELLQYVLWSAADVLLLRGVEAAHLLRLVPNTMYYALFLPFVLWRSRQPAETA